MGKGKKKRMDSELKKEMQKEYEELPLSLQIMHELKMSSQRWFIVSIAELIVIVLILLFVSVIPVEEYSTVTQELDSETANNITQTIGD